MREKSPQYSEPQGLFSPSSGFMLVSTASQLQGGLSIPSGLLYTPGSHVLALLLTQ